MIIAQSSPLSTRSPIFNDHVRFFFGVLKSDFAERVVVLFPDIAAFICFLYRLGIAKATSYPIIHNMMAQLHAGISGFCKKY
tara:strand:- start:184 stop:429 length:246 start_codon:yes stop_codon:yes gene_type:complete